MPKKYSLNIENDEVVSVEVDGVRYDSPEDIPDPEDRARMLFLMPLSPGELPTGPPPTPFPFEKIVIAVFLAVAAVLLSVSALTALSAKRAIAKERGAPGRVVDLETRRDADGDEFSYPVVEFALPDGRSVTTTLSEGSRPPAYEKGEAVTVLYDPDDPRRARSDSTASMLGRWILPAITGVLGVAFTIASLFAIRMLVAEPGPAEPKTG